MFTNKQLNTLKEWSNTIPSFFNSSVFIDTLYQYFGIEGNNISNPLDNIEDLLYPFYSVSPKNLQLIYIFQGSIEDNDCNGLGIGLKKKKDIFSTFDLEQKRLRDFIRNKLQIFPSFNVPSFDFTFQSWANQGILIFNEFLIDSSWGYNYYEEEKYRSALILRMFLEEIHKLNDKIPIVLNDTSLSYIKNYNINKKQIIEGDYLIPTVDLKRRNNNLTPIKWF